MQLKGNLMNQTWEIEKKLNFGGLILTHFGPDLVLKSFFVGFISSICYTLLQAITVCNFKEN